MAHELTTRLNGFTEMAYRKDETPWHTLGQPVDPFATIEEWTIQSGTDFMYLRAPAQFYAQISPIIVDGKVVTTELLEFPENHIIYRSDNKARMSIVGSGYKLVQPAQMLEFFRDLVSDAGFEIETVGTLKGGKKIWALAKTNLEAEIVDGDNVKAYLLLVTSCDGSLSTTAMFTSVRVVCNNTLSMALSGSNEGIVKIRHSTIFDPEAVKGRLGLLGQGAFGNYVSSMKMLTQAKLDNAKASSFLESLLKTAAEHGDVKKTKGYRTLMALFDGGAMGSEIEGVRGTSWGMLNAVTEYADYHIRARTVDNRFSSSQFGAGAVLKQQAAEMLLMAA